eukprot:g24697.t1
MDASWTPRPEPSSSGAQEGRLAPEPPARPFGQALNVARKLRMAGQSVDVFSEETKKVHKGFKYADRVNATRVAFVAPGEWEQGLVTIKEGDVPLEDLANFASGWQWCCRLRETAGRAAVPDGLQAKQCRPKALRAAPNRRLPQQFCIASMVSAHGILLSDPAIELDLRQREPVLGLSRSRESPEKRPSRGGGAVASEELITGDALGSHRAGSSSRRPRAESLWQTLDSSQSQATDLNSPKRRRGVKRKPAKPKAAPRGGGKPKAAAKPKPAKAKAKAAPRGAPKKKPSTAAASKRQRARS